MRLRAQHGRDVLAVIVEVQLRRDAEKRRTWPAYVANLHRKLVCQVELLVLAPRPNVARWARQPMAVTSTGFTLVPHVVDFHGIPAITDVEQAKGPPEIAFLSALAHARGPRRLEVAIAAATAARGLGEEARTLYLDQIRAALDHIALAALERAMEIKGYEWQSDIGRASYAKGREEGREEGRESALVDAILDLLDERGVVLSAFDVERIRAERREEVLRGWLRRAVRAATAAELFQQPG